MTNMGSWFREQYEDREAAFTAHLAYYSIAKIFKVTVRTHKYKRQKIDIFISDLIIVCRKILNFSVVTGA